MNFIFFFLPGLLISFSSSPGIPGRLSPPDKGLQVKSEAKLVFESKRGSMNDYNLTNHVIHRMNWHQNLCVF